MSLISGSDDFALYGVTPVENLFLLEYMPTAPGDCVRVYLYALMQVSCPGLAADLGGMARALNLSEEAALDALKYWEQKGLMIGLSDNPPSFRLVNIRTAMMNARPEDEGAYRYSDFNARLQEIFGLLHPQQFRQAMEWVEELKIPSDVILYMSEQENELMKLKNGGRQRSVNYAFKALNQTAMDWARRDIRTLEKAQAEYQKRLPPYQVARRVLDGFGLRRNPTSAEVTLTARWLEEWEYTEADVLTALKETVKCANPSFAYLDGVLKNHRTRTCATPLAMELKQTEKMREAVRGVLAELSAASREPADTLVSAYQGFLSKGFAPDTILRAAANCNRLNRHTFQELEDMLARWLPLGLTTPEAVDQYLKTRQELRKKTLEIFEKAGVDRRVSEADLDQTREWLEIAPDWPLILYAAECARGLSIPTRSITKRLKEYQQAGIVSVEAARAFKRPRPASSLPGEKTKPLPAQQYEQRTYTSDSFDDLFVDLSGPVKE